MFCVQQGDFTRLQTYKGLSTSLSARLGLHQSQKRFALGTLTCETRKKVFWTLYTVDSFTAVALGLPKHLKDEDVHCEYPVDADDEYVTEKGFTPTLPGESTKLSSALALFRAARILSKILLEVFPAKASYDLSLKKLGELSDELDGWSNSLPPHLRLHFAQDKPSTGTISSRSPLLSLTYHYIRALIQRPAICASLGARSSSMMMAMAGSCKHMIQIVQLLDERGLSFSFCLKRDEILVLSGFGLLFQGLGLEPSSKILKDNSKMITAVMDVLKKSHAPCAEDFERVATSFVTRTPAAPPATKTKLPTLSRHNSDSDASTQSHSSQSLHSSTKRQLKAIASRFTAGSNTRTPKLDATDNSRRHTAHNISLHPYGAQTQSQPSLQPSTSYDMASTSRSEPARSPANMYSRPNSTSTTRPSAPPQLKLKPKHSPQQGKNLNLDYLSFGTDSATHTPPNGRASQPIKTEPAPTDWEKLLGSLDNGETNIYDGIYGGPAIDALLDVPPLGMHHSNHSATGITTASDASSVAWNADLWALCQTDTNNSSSSGLNSASTGAPASVLSFSTDDGGLSGSEDFTADWIGAGSASASANESYRGIVMPHGDEIAFGTFWE